MEFSRKKNLIFVLSLVWVFLFSSFFVLEKGSFSSDELHEVAANSAATVSNVRLPIDLPIEEENLSEDHPEALLNPPSIIRGVYVTSWSASSKSYLAYLDQLFKKTEINAVVVDLKDNSGMIAYETYAEKAREYGNFRRIIDIDKLVRHFHDREIYVIARINVFNDSALAKARPDLAIYQKSQTPDSSKLVLWQDSSRSHWLDPAAEDVLIYNFELAQDAIDHGFDEINFDYIRYPSDGKLKEIGYPFWDSKTPRHLIMSDFFFKMRQLMPEAKISADFFGQTTTTSGDMGIGQVFEDGLEDFDYICPMVYPSHYINGFMGYDNPSEYPYEIVKVSMESALARQYSHSKENPEKKMAKIRPWLQDFDMGADYNAAMVKKEIDAVKDALGENFAGYLLWNPLNLYTMGSILRVTTSTN